MNLFAITFVILLVAKILGYSISWWWLAIPLIPLAFLIVVCGICIVVPMVLALLARLLD